MNWRCWLLRQHIWINQGVHSDYNGRVREWRCSRCGNYMTRRVRL